MKLEGAITALLTPYDSVGEVSEDLLRSLAEAHISAGATGLYLCGGGGEGLLLTPSERKRVAEAVIAQARGRLPVIVHVGSLTTDQSVELARHAQDAGADAIASIPPFYYPVSTEGIHQHYARIAENCSLPMFLYNIPSSVGITVTPEMMAGFIRIPTVIGMKFSSYNLFQLRQMLDLDNGRLNVLSGNDEVFLAALAMGAHGSIGLTHNFMPKLYLDIFETFRSGRWDRAQELQFFSDRVISVLLKYPVIPATKAIMRMKGYDCGRCRGPLESLTEAQEGQLCEELSGLGFFEKALGL